MAKFDEIRKIMKDFKQDIDGLANRKIEEMDTAKARLNPTALQEELYFLIVMKKCTKKKLLKTFRSAE